MGRIAYVNGQYVPHADAAVHIEDRGYQFSDGVYEVLAIYRGELIDEKGHMDRLERSLRELEIAAPMGRKALGIVMRQTIRRNRVGEGIIYLQITRGVAPRDHAFPSADTTPCLVMTVAPRNLKALMTSAPVSVITVPDQRWARRDIKTVSLLPNCLGKQKAREAGVYEALQVDAEGFVTEGTSSNAWIVTAAGELVTRKADQAILNGITRIAVIEIAREHGVTLVERPFTVDEIRAAREAFVTSTTSFVKPVARIDGATVGDGGVGPLTAKLRAFYTDYLEHQGRGTDR